MKKYLVLGVLTVFLLHSNAWSKEELKWLVIDWPPYQMLEGPEQGMGRFDALLDMYIKNLPQYDHKKVEMNWARFWTGVKEGQEVCNIFAIKTEEREQIAAFSTANSFGIPVRAVMRKSTSESLGNPLSVSLSDIVKDRRLKGVLESKRSYGPALDKILTGIQGSVNFERVAIPSDSVIQMLLSGRVDYSIEYPFVAYYLAEKHASLYKEPLISIPIEDGPRFYESYVACPKNEWGEMVLKDINTMLEKVKQDPEYLRILQKGYTNQEERDLMQDNYSTYFLQLD
ncbi:MAG: TIGR02285 family protein [Desulfatibacillum sp.]|nr:TIGR02285 family protein [Desulfatibacillum sp.]